MKIIPAPELSSSHRDLWCDLQERDSRFASPYFRPEYTESVARIRDDVFMAVIEHRGKPAGFYPFQRVGRSVGQPVGLRMSNYQGVIIPREIDWQPTELARACGLSILDFDHLICDQSPLVPFHTSVTTSPVMDVSDGWEAYTAERQKSGSRTVKEIQRKMRKVERELGPLRFTPHSSDPAHLDQLVTWKREQYMRTDVHGSLMHEWAVNVCREILSQQGDKFAGMLSVLHAGDKLLAVHMGMRSSKHWHWWYPTYDQTYSSYSPGVILLLKMAEWAPSKGIELIDLGRGTARYKESLSNGQISVAYASVILPSISGYLRRLRNTVRHVVRRSPALRSVRDSVRKVQRSLSGEHTHQEDTKKR